MEKHTATEVKDQIPEPRSCPMCNADNLPMGIMGNLMHYCCEACGMWYSASVPKALRLKGR